MLVEIAGADYTNLIAHPSMQGSKATTDPLESMTFEFVDIGSQLPLTVGTPITVWDDSTPSSRIAVPTRNYIVNQLIAGSSPTTPYGPWVKGGALSNLLAFQIYESQYDMAMTFNNTTYSGGNNSGYIYQNVGHSMFTEITPGHTYMASVTMVGSGTISNIGAFVQMQYLDGQYNPLGSLLITAVTPTTSAQKIYVSGTAPAGTVFCQVAVGGEATVSGSNSGTITFVPLPTYNSANVCLEPVLFGGQYLADGTPITYPTPDCTVTVVDCVGLPDGSSTRARWIFNGYIKDIKVTYDGTNRLYTLDCAPMGDVIDNGALINANFENTTDQNIINNLVNTYFTGMLSTGTPSFPGPPTTVQFGQNISAVAYGDATMRDVMNSLSDSTGFIYYVDEYNYLYYNDTPFNYSTYSVNVEHPDYVTAFPPQHYQVEYDGSQLENSVKVLGGQYYTVSTDTFSGNGTTKDFTLSSIPSGMNSITVGGVAQNKIGVYGQDTLGVNGVVVTYDRNSSVIHFQIAPASGTNNVLVTYPTYRNVAILVEDNQSIAQYNRRFTAKVTDTTIADSPTAQIRGIAEVGKYSQPLVILTFDLNVYIPRGLAVQVSSALDGFVAQSFIVQQVNVKAEGGGVFVYSYVYGVYRPSMIDAMRNTSKALQSNTATSGSTVIQLTVESMNENIYYGDALTAQSGTPTVATYGTYKDTVLADTPNAYYRLGESSGTTATDSSGNGFNGTYSSTGVTYARPGALAGDSTTSVLFDGSSGEMTMPSGVTPGGWTAFTLEAWVRLSTTGYSGGATIFSNGNVGSSHNGFTLSIKNGAASLNFTVGNGTTSTTFTPSFTFAASTWYHIVATYNGSTMLVYVNGTALSGSGSLTGSVGTPSNNTAVGYQPGGSGYFSGQVQEAAVYKSVALSSTRITAHYNKGTVVPPVYGFASYN